MKIAMLAHMVTPFEKVGVLTYLNDFEKYCNRFNIGYSIFGYNSTLTKPITEYNKSMLNSPIQTYNDKDKLLEQLNDFDMVILFSQLTKTKGDHVKSQEEFVFEIWKNIKGVKAFQMHQASYGDKLKEHPYINEIIDSCDIVMSRSKEHPVSKLALSKGKSWFQLKLFYDFDQFGNHLEHKQKLISAIGRPVGFKKLKPLGENVHKLIPYMSVCYPNERQTRTFEENLELFSKSSICFAPTSTKRLHEYAGQLEYVQMEALAHNCILVLNKKQGQSCYYKGTRWLDIPNLAIWFDENNPDQCWEDIKEVMSDIETNLKKYTTLRNIIENELDPQNFLFQIKSMMNVRNQGE